MRAVIFGILAAVCLLASPACVVWAIIDFIIYLAKDVHSFNWWSLILAGVFAVLFFVFLLYAAYYSEVEDTEYIKARKSLEEDIRLDNIESDKYLKAAEPVDGKWKDYFSDVLLQKRVALSIKSASNICAGLARDAGWDSTPREVGTELMLIVSEIAEAMEGDRKSLMDDHLPNRPMLEVELADAMIRILHFAGKYNLDLGGAVVDKLLYNMNREDHKIENRNKVNGKKY